MLLSKIRPIKTRIRSISTWPVNIKPDTVNINLDPVNINLDLININLDPVNIKPDPININLDPVNLNHDPQLWCVAYVAGSDPVFFKLRLLKPYLSWSRIRAKFVRICNPSGGVWAVNKTNIFRQGKSLEIPSLIIFLFIYIIS